MHCDNTNVDRGFGHPLVWIRWFLAESARAYEYRRSAERLVKLGDHELSDIGLTRADADFLARHPDTLPDHLRRC